MIIIPDMNPIIFFDQSKAPDWETYFPNNEIIDERVQYNASIYPTLHWKDHLINEAITLQFQNPPSLDTSISVTKPDGTTDVVNGIDITPTGWTGDDVYKYIYTPTSAGIYQFYFNGDTDIISRKVLVHDVLKFRKRLVEITYYNTSNDYGMIFYDLAVNKYIGKTYFTGQLLTYPINNDKSVFTSDRGTLVSLRSTPVKKARLILADIHYSYAYNINMIFSCDRLTINGINYQLEDIPDPEPIEKSDLINMTFELSQTDNLFSKTA